MPSVPFRDSHVGPADFCCCPSCCFFRLASASCSDVTLFFRQNPPPASLLPFVSPSSGKKSEASPAILTEPIGQPSLKDRPLRKSSAPPPLDIAGVESPVDALSATLSAGSAGLATGFFGSLFLATGFFAALEELELLDDEPEAEEDADEDEDDDEELDEPLGGGS